MPQHPPPRARAFHTPKRGHAPDEYEDAFAADPARGRFAVADGASESSFAGPWARRLAEGFVAAGRPWRLDWLGPARQGWAEEVDGLPLPWYGEEKREQGAFATLLGVAFRKPKPDTGWAAWRALAVGDSCLFRVRAGRLRRSFPLRRSADFGNRPGLLGSRDGPSEAVRRARGRWRPGDRFLLMTDALAEWTLRRAEQGGNPAVEIEGLLGGPDSPDAFAAWVEERRDRDGLRNDDVTLLVIDLE